MKTSTNGVSTDERFVFDAETRLRSAMIESRNPTFVTDERMLSYYWNITSMLYNHSLSLVRAQQED